MDFESRLNSLRVNLLNRFDFPTPESPMRTTGEMLVSLERDNLGVGGGALSYP